MKLSEDWLREWVAPPCDAEGIGERLTLGGLELESLSPVAPPFSGVVVAEVLEVSPHPDADRLRVCQVADGGEAARQVVCGAPNVRPGLKAALARPGARLPGGGRIREAALRGVASSGMLCGAGELGLSSEGEGLLELPPELQPGEDLRSALRLDDTVIELNVTPNRGDCLSVLGVARELAALCELPLSVPEPAPVPARFDQTVPVALEPGAGCVRYVGRVLQDVDASRPTPAWMRTRLERGGVRCINVVVDITNYVMLELGQPMHAFDLAQLQPGLEARGSRPGESLSLLDGQTLDLEPGTLVIADSRGPVALAGIMGGSTSSVSDATRSVLLESALFDPVTIALRARHHRLATDSSHRFERGVDPGLQRRACERASALLEQLCGARCGPLFEAGSAPPPAADIELPAARIERVLGCRIPAAEVEAMLGRLGISVRATAEGWLASPPSWRHDLRITADLIEELGRVWGYDRIPANAPGGRLALRPGAGARGPAEAARNRLVERGYMEAVSFSFVDADWQRALAPNDEALRLSNPIAADLSVMRTDLWPGLLRALSHNQKRQQQRVALFELGTVFRAGPTGLSQPQRLGGVLWGLAAPEQWGTDNRRCDFHDLKGDVEAVLALSGRRPRWTAAAHPALHPGQSASLGLEGDAPGAAPRGWLGALHPATAARLELEGPVFLFELELEALGRPAPAAFEPVSRFPAVRRDLSLLLDRAVSAARVLELGREAAGPLLKDLELFDVYDGEGIDPLKKSLAVRLTFQSACSTLVEEAVDEAVRAVVRRLADDLGATLRE